MYKSNAQQFRPKFFHEVIGQEAIVTTLKNAVKLKQVSHAYLFCGNRGTGKTTLARLLAKALNCQSPTEDCEPCNTCSACKEIAAGNSLDVIEIDGASNRGIDDVRNINDTLHYTTAHNRYKIFIIDEVHMLTKEAFNALLKSLEEPPEFVKFFLATTEPQKVLPTIISRCQRFHLTRISNSLIIRKLRNICQKLSVEIDDAALSVLAKMGEGSLRDAEILLDQCVCLGKALNAKVILEHFGALNKEIFFQLDEAFSQGDLSYAFKLSQVVFDKGQDFTIFLENVLEHYRNLALILLGQARPENISPLDEEVTGYKKAEKIYTKEQVLYILDYLSALIHQSTRPVYKKIHIEMILLYILESRRKVSVDDILHKIDSLSHTTPATTTSAVEPKSVEKPPAPKVILDSSKESCPLETENMLRFAQVELGGVLKKETNSS